MSHYKNWEISTDSNNIVWLGINVQHSSANVLNSDALNELDTILEEVSQMPKAKGLVIYSSKDSGFIAGADVKEFAHFTKPAQIMDFLTKGQNVFCKLEALPLPTVAIIHGFCMGGGLELALACDYRIASLDRSTKLGLPEVLLGIHPGWGGTVRLTKLIGGFNALSQIILTGKGLNAKRCKKLGVIDDAVAHRQLKRAAAYYIEKTPKKHQASASQKLTNFSISRKIIANMLRKFVAKRAAEQHYPAPYSAIKLWETDGKFNQQSYTKEADSVANLITTNKTAQNLTRLFLIRERMKAFAKKDKFNIAHVHIIGAGVMGGDIAAWCALRGLSVTIQDQSYAKIAPAIGRAHKLYKKRLRIPRLVEQAMDNLLPDPEGEGLKSADLIIEAVFESIDVKQAIFKDVERKAKAAAILATNTSSIPLDEISSVMRKPDRLVGIHFFNPVAQMELVEVVNSDVTSPVVVEKASTFVSQIGKLPLPVKSSPGFLINRVLTPYLLAAMQLFEEGYAPEVIDNAAQKFGMVMGPVELADTVGMDICLAVADNLGKFYNYDIPKKLRDMVESGKLGRKTGIGFYKYKNGKPQKNKLKDNQKQPDLASRLIQPMIDEASKCLQEGVVQDSELLDGGMVFATGFAPFRGGPMHYAESVQKTKPDKSRK